MPEEFEALRHASVAELEIHNISGQINLGDLVTGLKQEFDNAAPYATPVVYPQVLPTAPPTFGVKIILHELTNLAILMNVFAEVLNDEMERAGVCFSLDNPLQVRATDTRRGGYDGPRLRGH